MHSYQAALELIGALRATFASERLPLAACAQRLLATDLVAKIPSPPFTNAAMDGFAIKYQDAHQALKIKATIFAKALRAEEIPTYTPAACVRIMTGAVVPGWADTVIPVEDSEVTADGTVTFKKLPTPGSHIRLQGDDIVAGAPLLKSGTRLTAERLMVAAAFGYPELEVRQQPRVLLLTTGDELCEPGESLPLGAIYNSSRYFLQAAVEKLGLQMSTVKTLTDDESRAAAVIQDLIADEARPTLILTTGAVSAGEKDFVPHLARHLGFDALLHKVAIRPGKPVFLARRSSPRDQATKTTSLVWLGLPGNPISTCVGWHFFARPLLSAWAGMPQAERRVVKLKNAVVKPEGLRCFYRAEVNGRYAWVGRNQGSAELAPSINVEAYVDLPEGIAHVAADTKVEAVFI